MEGVGFEPTRTLLRPSGFQVSLPGVSESDECRAAPKISGERRSGAVREWVLRVPTIRDFEEIAAAAQREQLSYFGFVGELVMAECDDRDRRRAARRIHDAGFPRDERIEEFDFEASSSVSPAVIHQLVTCTWVKAGHPLCLIGDSGTGKSHLLIGLGAAAAEAGYRVRYTLASKLVNELVEAADDKQLSKAIARYGRVDLLCLDELGYMELDRRRAELLFQVLTE